MSLSTVTEDRMADQDCIKTCEDAYRDRVKTCFRVLVECLEAADTPEKKATCKDRFSKCKQIGEEAKRICIENCG